MKARTAAIVILCGAFLFHLGCRERSPGWAGTIEEQDGVIVVKNPATPVHDGQILALEEELSIGRDSGKEEHLFTRVNGMDVDDDGNIYVIDGLDAHIRVFDKNGVFLRTIGRKGQGPGEFQMPLHVQITADGEVLVGDYLGSRAVYFSLDGQFVRQRSMPRPIRLVKQDSQGGMVGIEVPAPPPGGGKTIKKYDADFRPLVIIAAEETGAPRVFDIGKPSCYCAVTPNDHVVWGDSGEYVLHVLDSQGKPIKKILKAHRPQRISAADREEYEKRYAEPLQAGMKIAFRDHYPAFSDIATDDEGRIYVRTYEKADPNESFHYHDVFDAKGIYIAKILLKVNLDRSSVWKRKKLYTLESSPEGFPVIKRYGVNWWIE